MGFPYSSVGEESACNAGDPDLIPGSGRSTGEGKGYPLQHSGLENSMDSIVHRVTKSRTRLSDFHCSLLISRAEVSHFLKKISICKGTPSLIPGKKEEGLIT